jgi:hypothetical protein
VTDLPPIYIRAVRISRTDARGLLIGEGRHDRLYLHLPGGYVWTDTALTVATHTEREAAPIIAPGWHPRAYAIGPHGRREHRRQALVHWGEPLRWTRGGREETGYTGLNIHDDRGRSDGCILAPDWWMQATMAALRAHGLGGPGGEVGLLMQEPLGPHLVEEMAA